MPQLAKGGKFIYGWVTINVDLSINIPIQIIEEYTINNSNIAYLMSGSRSTGGFCVLPKNLLENSKLKKILDDLIELKNCTSIEQEYIKYKGRKYSWTKMYDKKIYLKQSTLNEFNLKVGDKLLSIRSSDIAFTLGLKGPLVEFAKQYKGVIETY